MSIMHLTAGDGIVNDKIPPPGVDGVGLRQSRKTLFGSLQKLLRDPNLKP